MNDIAARFRPRLGDDWPKPLPEMLDAALGEDSHAPERVIGMVLGTWSEEEGLDGVLREALAHDLLAFDLSDNHGSEWGDTYFGPWGSMRSDAGEVVTSPRRERLTKDAIEHWRGRAEQLEHHVARARYSDAAWDLAPLVGLERRRDDAIRSVDSYIGQCANSASELHLERCLCRAHALACAVGDKQRTTNVRTSLLELGRLAEMDACDRLRFLACDLYLLDKKSTATDKEKNTILGWMEDGLKRCVKHGDPFDGELFAQRLDLHYRRLRDSDAQKRVARAFGGLLETWAALGSGMLAMHNYKKAHEVYQTAGLAAEAKTARALVQDATARSQDELARFSASVEIPEEKMEAIVESIAGQEWPEAIRRFVGEFVDGRNEFEKQLNTWLENSTMYGFMPLTVITGSGDSVHLKSPTEDRESHLILKGTEVLRFAEVFMWRVLDELFVRHEVTPEKLVEITDESPLFSDDRRGIVKRAVKAYLLGDFTTFVHLVIPQVEHSIRILFRHAAEKATTTSRDSKRWRTITLNQILDADSLRELLGEDVVLYLRVVLTHDLGMNMRNLVCHGLVSQSWFTRGRADRLLHVVLLLALLVRGGATTEQGRQATTPGGSEDDACTSP